MRFERQLCALAVLALTACGAGANAQPSPSPSASPIPQVAVGITTIHPKLVMPGSLAPFESVALSSTIAEPAAGVFVQEGDRVRAGQVLAQLNVDDLQSNLQAALQTAAADRAKASETQYTAQLAIAQVPDQVRQAQAQLSQSQATLLEARRNQTRDVNLVNQGYLPQLNLDEQNVVVRNDEQALAAAQAAVHSAQANQHITGDGRTGLQAAEVEESQDEAAAQAATAEQIRRQIALATIVSPVDGVVINRNLNPGEYPSGRQLFTIEANAVVYGILTASAIQAYQLHPGDTVSLFRAGMPRGTFAGRVVAILDAGTAGSTNFTVKVSVPNRDDALRPGTPIDATVSLLPVTGLAVPESAFTDDTRTHIVTLVDGKPRLTAVEEVATDGTTSIVRGPLSSGDLIARDGTTPVSDGQPAVASR